jgi:hypothetical protein
MADAGPSVQQRIALPVHDRRCIGAITISTEIGRIGTGIAPGIGTGIEAPRYSEISDRQLLSSAVNIFVESVLVNIYQW